MSEDSSSEPDVATDDVSKPNRQRLSPEAVMKKCHKRVVKGNSWIKPDLNGFLSQCDVYCMLCCSYIKIGAAKIRRKWCHNIF
jgi:hypothetical protein